MATQAFLLMDQTQADAVNALWDDNADDDNVGNVQPVLITNALANQLGQGDIDNDHYVAPARILNDPMNVRYRDLCSTFPIFTWDSDVLFTPDPD